MPKKLFTTKQEKFLEKNIKGKPYTELTMLFNKHFKTDFTKMQIKSACHHKNLRNGIPPCNKKDEHVWTKEQLLFLEKNAGENPSRKLTALINNTFNLSLSRKQVRSACYFYKIKTLRSAPNKCPEEIAAFIHENCKGNISDMMSMINDAFGTAYTRKQVEGFVYYYKYKIYRNKKDNHELPLQTERIKRGGYIFIKVSMKGTWSQKWKAKHRWIWEQAHGKIPEGMDIIFLDSNPQNCELENLAMVSIAELLKMHTQGLCFDNREATLAGIAIVRHSMAIHEQIRKNLGIEEHIRFVKRESAKRRYKRKEKEEKANAL